MGEETSLVDCFDDLIALQEILIDDSEQEFLQFVINQEDCRLQWCAAVEECKKLQAALEKTQKALIASENSLHCARRMLDKERQRRRQFEEENLALERLVARIRDCHVPLQNQLNEEIEEILHSAARSARNSIAGSLRLSTISDATGSILTDLSVTRSEDNCMINLDGMSLRSGKNWKQQRPSYGGGDVLPTKCRRSSIRLSNNHIIEAAEEWDHLEATNTVCVSRRLFNDAYLMESSEYKENVTEAAPNVRETRMSSSTHNRSSISTWTMARNSGSVWLAPDAGMSFEAIKRINCRQHCFEEKTVLKREECTPCGKRINFGKIALKCGDCKVVCHTACKDEVSLPCAPLGSTPAAKKVKKVSIADYAPAVAPMIPSIVIHCVNEVESRGLNEVGIYSVTVSEEDVKFLKEKFLEGKGAPNLHGYDIHVVCGVLKDFLRSLTEPIISFSLWDDFGKAAESTDALDSVALLYHLISELPRPNRDTLAYLIIHLQKVASCRECKMPAKNLVEEFEPTIFGCTYSNISPEEINNDIRVHHKVIKALMKIPTEYWSSFIKPDSNTLNTPQCEIPYGTPSTEKCGTPATVIKNRAWNQRGSGRLFSSSNRWKGMRFFDSPTVKHSCDNA
ncbi:rac GTPase-activating protein 1-like [Ischnura elegans]|uniref:rac GTPase-activating protein 1-like n=1 Tax=Ischnura elegans TaxID=197161 RepID=UPI001ED86788|nr:rac GTPase-activating protein 1-like [Ischnura elegans]